MRTRGLESAHSQGRECAVSASKVRSRRCESPQSQIIHFVSSSLPPSQHYLLSPFFHIPRFSLFPHYLLSPFFTFLAFYFFHIPRFLLFPPPSLYSITSPFCHIERSEHILKLQSNLRFFYKVRSTFKILSFTSLRRDDKTVRLFYILG